MFQWPKKKCAKERDEAVLALWQEQKIFQKSLALRRDAPVKFFLDGPPFATGLPHYGHMLAGVLKDLFPRYLTMRGFHVPRRFGWDCHGLPIEQEQEKALQLSGRHAIEAYGIDRFNAACRSNVLRYTQQWQHFVERLGRWVDMQQPLRTMDDSYMESVWWVFSQLWEKGLIYEGVKVMPYSWKLGTPLSNFEASDNYKEVDSAWCVVGWKLEDGTSLLAWTTTPWTLVSNMALAVDPNLTYGCYHHEGVQIIVTPQAKERFFPNATLIKTVQGAQLVGRCYTPLFGDFADQDAFRVIAGKFIDAQEGTGIVHMAPAFGEDDFYACQEADIPWVNPIDADGCFDTQVPWLQGMLYSEANAPIKQRLKAMGALFAHGSLRHRYPFCWRSDTPLIYRATQTWFVKVTQIKEQLCLHNQAIQWRPHHLRDGRFGKWLAGARDWAISRNRYWGAPIPVWRSAAGTCLIMSSKAMLEQYCGHPVPDMHRPQIDQVVFTHAGETFRRIPEVFDCWFESGSMPFAQVGYPHTTPHCPPPAHFIAEGLDQTRGWFYTLHILSVALLQRPAFERVIVNGIVLAADGQKMSKRLKNYPDPLETLDQYGADALRLYLLHSPAARGDDLRFSTHDLEVLLRQILQPLRQAAIFLQTYATLTPWKYTETLSQDALDQWICARTDQLHSSLFAAFEESDMSNFIPPLVQFCDQLTNWYIRRSRRRFWSATLTSAQQEAFDTLTRVLRRVAQLIAPLTPFIAEELYQDLRDPDQPLSVHLTHYPDPPASVAEDCMVVLQRICTMGHALRKKHNLKVRQPLASITVTSQYPQPAHCHLIEEELNVHTVHWKQVEALDQWAFELDYRRCGKKFGRAVPLLKEYFTQASLQDIATFQTDKRLTVTLDGTPYVLEEGDVTLVPMMPTCAAHQAYEEGLFVALDCTLTPALLEEGLARTWIHLLNAARKEAHFSLSDRIAVVCWTEAEQWRAAFERYQAFIQEQTLIDTWCWDRSAAQPIAGGPTDLKWTASL